MLLLLSVRFTKRLSAIVLAIVTVAMTVDVTVIVVASSFAIAVRCVVQI